MNVSTMTLAVSGRTSLVTKLPAAFSRFALNLPAPMPSRRDL